MQKNIKNIASEWRLELQTFTYYTCDVFWGSLVLLFESSLTKYVVHHGTQKCDMVGYTLVTVPPFNSIRRGHCIAHPILKFLTSGMNKLRTTMSTFTSSFCWRSLRRQPFQLTKYFCESIYLTTPALHLHHTSLTHTRNVQERAYLSPLVASAFCVLPFKVTAWDSPRWLVIQRAGMQIMCTFLACVLN